MVLCGSNVRNESYSFCYNILYKSNSVKISGGTYNVPLTIENSDLNGFLSVTPLGFHRKKLTVNIIKQKPIF